MVTRAVIYPMKCINLSMYSCHILSDPQSVDLENVTTTTTTTPTTATTTKQPRNDKKGGSVAI